MDNRRIIGRRPGMEVVFRAKTSAAKMMKAIRTRGAIKVFQMDGTAVSSAQVRALRPRDFVSQFRPRSFKSKFSVRRTYSSATKERN